MAWLLVELCVPMAGTSVVPVVAVVAAILGIAARTVLEDPLAGGAAYIGGSCECFYSVRVSSSLGLRVRKASIIAVENSFDQTL